MKPGRLCALLQVCSQNHLGFFQIPCHSLLKAWFACVVEASLHFHTVTEIHWKNMTFYLFTLLQIRTLTHTKNHLLCTFIAFCRQINIVLTGKRKAELKFERCFRVLNDMAFVLSFRLFFLKFVSVSCIHEEVCMTLHMENIVFPHPPQTSALPSQDWKPNICWILACTTLVQKLSF